MYSLGSSSDKTAQKIVVSYGVAKLADGSKFAGSVQLLNRMVRNLVFDCGISIQDAVRMASYTPASVIKAESEIGSVSVGKKADLCLMDREMNVVMTISDGKIIA